LGNLFFQSDVGSSVKLESNDSLRLREGRMLVGAQRSSVIVSADKVDVTCPEQVIVIISTAPEKATRITVLDSPDGADVPVKVNGEVVSSLTRGQEAIVSSKDIGDEELISVDGIAREPIGGRIEQQGLHIQKARVPVARLLATDPLIGGPCHSSESAPQSAWLYNRLSNRYHSDLASQSSSQLISQLPSDKYYPEGTTSYLMCGQGESNATTGGAMAKSNSAARTGGIRLAADSELSEVGPGVFNLTKGAALAAPIHPIDIKVGDATLKLKPHSAVLISLDKNITRVLSMAGSGSEQCELQIGRYKVPMNPGKEVGLVANQNVPTRELISADGVGRRAMHLIPFANDSELLVADFSLVDAMKVYPLLTSLRKSRDGADRGLAEQIIRTAASLSLSIDRSRGPYGYGRELKTSVKTF
jgi:hypothetical protein